MMWATCGVKTRSHRSRLSLAIWVAEEGCRFLGRPAFADEPLDHELPGLLVGRLAAPEPVLKCIGHLNEVVPGSCQLRGNLLRRGVQRYMSSPFDDTSKNAMLGATGS
jgi:hypothetical protein